MASITQPPFVIDSTTLPRGAPPNAVRFWGPLVRNGNLYMLGWLQSSVPRHWKIYKSTDQGSTWTLIGSSAFAVSTGNPWFWQTDVVAPNLLTFISNIDDIPPVYYDFDLDTETWSSSYADSGPATTRGFARRSDGSLVVIYNSSGLKYDSWTSGGGWAGGNVLSSETLLDAVYVDSSDRVHLIYGPNAHPRYNSIDSGNTLGTEHDFGSFTSLDVWNLFATSDSKLIFTVSTGDTGNFNVKTFQGDSLGGSPTWTLEDVAIQNFDPGNPSPDIDWVMGAEIGGLQTVFWLQSDFLSGDFDTQIYYSQRVSGTWAAPTLYFDLEITPPGSPFDPTPEDMISFSFMDSSTSGTGFGVMAEIDVTITGISYSDDTPFYLKNGTTARSLSFSYSE